MSFADWSVGAVFGAGYAALVTAVALLAAIPYGAWQGVRWLGRRLAGGRDGNS